MGFGAYDESEQENQDVDGTDIETSDDDREEYNGDVEYEIGSTDELVDQLQEMK